MTMPAPYRNESAYLSIEEGQLQVPDWAPDVDHEVAQLLELQSLIEQPDYEDLPLVLRRAVRVAYATHFRVLMEFFHDGRPKPGDWERIPDDPPSDIGFSQITRTGSSRFSGRWGKKYLERFRDADKLVAHLSGSRATRRGRRREWGGRGDWRQLEPKIRSFLKVARTRVDAFPLSVAVADRLAL